MSINGDTLKLLRSLYTFVAGPGMHHGDMWLDGEAALWRSKDSRPEVSPRIRNVVDLEPDTAILALQRTQTDRERASVFSR